MKSAKIYDASGSNGAIMAKWVREVLSQIQ